MVTDPRLQLAQTERFLGEADSGALHLGEYRVFSTSGTTGIPGLFVYSRAEFAHWLAVMLRSMVRLGLRPGTRLVGVGAPSALHISQQSIAALQAAGRSDAPRLSVLTPLEETVGHRLAERIGLERVFTYGLTPGPGSSTLRPSKS